MISKFLPHLCLVFLFGCSGESETEHLELVSDSDDTERIAEDTSDYYVPDNPVTRPYALQELPKDWILLEEDTDGMLYILDHWESQEQGIHFGQTDEGEWYLSIYMAQDSDEGNIENFQAQIKEGEGISIVTGSFDYLSQYTGDRTVKLEWDQMRYHATFEGIQLGSETFASENEKRMYEVVVVEREEDD